MTRDFKGLLTFQIVVREGGFSAAARQLQVTPGAVSRAIARLETEIGVRLFNRTPVEFHLTPEGEHLARLIGDKLNALDAAILDFRRASESPNGVVRVSLPNSYGKTFPAQTARLPRPTSRHQDRDCLQRSSPKADRGGI